MKVLITGISGQTGSYLAEYYLSQGWNVHGFIRQRTNLAFILEIEPKLELHIQDIRDPHGVWATIKDEQFDVIHHLAAMTYVPYSWNNPLDTMQTNVDGTINILEAVRTESPHTVIQFAGSSEEYGALTPEDTPTSENTIPKPASPYGVSKYAVDLLFQQYHRSWGMKTVITRTFNHESPRRGDQFVSTQVVKQALEIKHGKREAYSLGNLKAIRDYSDARDIARAYFIAANSGKINFGEPYNVSSMSGHSVLEMVNTVSFLAGVTAPIRQDPKRMRPSDVPVMLGDSTKFRNATGWKPQYSFSDMLRYMLEELEREIYP